MSASRDPVVKFGVWLRAKYQSTVQRLIQLLENLVMQVLVVVPSHAVLCVCGLLEKLALAYIDNANV